MSPRKLNLDWIRKVLADPQDRDEDLTVHGLIDHKQNDEQHCNASRRRRPSSYLGRKGRLTPTVTKIS